MDLINDLIAEDLNPQALSGVYSVPEDLPSLRQIHGGCLPANYLMFLKEYLHVTTAHSDPHAHHDTNGYMHSKLMARKNHHIDELGESIRRFLHGGHVRVSGKTRIREEGDGLVATTSELTSFYLNSKAKSLMQNLESIQRGLNPVNDRFMMRLILVGILEVT